MSWFNFMYETLMGDSVKQNMFTIIVMRLTCVLSIASVCFLLRIAMLIAKVVTFFSERSLTLYHTIHTIHTIQGSQKREIPKGFLFNLVACPNYTFEVMSWVGFSIMTQLLFSWAFTLVGFLQMADWAMKKHKGYKKTYGKEYIDLKRKAIIPFVY